MKYLGVIAMVVCFVVIPISTYAQTQDTSQGFGLIPCGNIVDENGAVGTDQCKFEDFIGKDFNSVTEINKCSFNYINKLCFCNNRIY